MFHYKYEVSFGHILIMIVVVAMFIFVVYRMGMLARTLQDVLITARVSAGHSKLSNEAAVGNSEKIKSTEAKIVAAVDKAKDDIIVKAADVASNLRQETPAAGILMPDELRVVIAHETAKPL